MIPGSPRTAEGGAVGVRPMETRRLSELQQVLGYLLTTARQQTVENIQITLAELGVHPADDEWAVAGMGHGQPVEDEPEMVKMWPVLDVLHEVQDHLRLRREGERY